MVSYSLSLEVGRFFFLFCGPIVFGKKSSACAVIKLPLLLNKTFAQVSSRKKNMYSCNFVGVIYTWYIRVF